MVGTRKKGTSNLGDAVLATIPYRFSDMKAYVMRKLTVAIVGAALVEHHERPRFSDVVNLPLVSWRRLGVVDRQGNVRDLGRLLGYPAHCR